MTCVKKHKTVQKTIRLLLSFLQQAMNHILTKMF